MLRIIVGISFALLSITDTIAWEISRNGPLLPYSKANAEAVVRGGHEAVAPLAAASSAFLSRKTVDYPYQSGARLGDGWDLLTNTRVFSQCIEFGTAATDAYQQANLDFKTSIDEETLSVALNINTSASASGSFFGIGGSAGGSFGLDSSYKFTSKDDVIVARASVINGATYVTSQNAPPAPKPGEAVTAPTKPNIAGVRLSDGALAKLGKDRDLVAFRSACGDGFVAAIGTGADLYLLYHFSHVDTATRVKISTSANASGGISGFFSASGSMSSTIDFSDLISKDQLGIYFVQNGGKIAALPTKREDVATRVAALPGEAFQNGRPLYMVVVPYSELYNWPINFEASPLIDLRTSLVRYLQRIRSNFNELQQIISDFRTPPAGGYEYLHDHLHRLRATDYASLNDELLAEIARVSTALRTLDARCSRTPSSKACRKAIADLPVFDFDDFRYWIQLPLPQNTLSSTDLNAIKDLAGDVSARKYTLSIALFNHWVDRTAKVRCSMFFECLDGDRRRKEYARIRATLGI